ncbi:MAG: prepilin peptidase [Methylacidiphilales bacterium]|nr:prepilin peptidase [Candidatus Methylacidiphilales bacterium]
MVSATVILLSLCVGSFIGMLCYRLPNILQKYWAKDCKEYLAEYEISEINKVKNLGLALPSSHCPNCNTPLRIIDNIPILSYLLLQGKCHYCKKTIAIDYFICEISTVILAIYLFNQYDISSNFFIYAIFNTLLLALIMIDARHGLLPDILTLPLLWIGLLLSALSESNVIGLNLKINMLSAHDAIIYSVIGYMALAIPNAIFRLIKKQDGVGAGDMKLLAAFGAWFGLQGIMVPLVIGSVLGTFYALIKKLRGKDASAVSFGPFLGIGILVYQYLTISN